MKIFNKKFSIYGLITFSSENKNENEEQELTEEESGVNEVINWKKTKKIPVKIKKIAEKSNKRTTKKQVGIIDYINK